MISLHYNFVKWIKRWQINIYNIFNPMEIFFSRDVLADVMSVHDRNRKHAHAIEFWLVLHISMVTFNNFFKLYIFATRKKWYDLSGWKIYVTPIIRTRI